jgi:hypothetical protein
MSILGRFWQNIYNYNKNVGLLLLKIVSAHHSWADIREFGFTSSKNQYKNARVKISKENFDFKKPGRVFKEGEMCLSTVNFFLFCF